MTRPTLRELVQSGEAQRLCDRLGSWAAVARHLGVNEVTLRKVRRQVGVPSGTKSSTAGENLPSGNLHGNSGSAFGVEIDIPIVWDVIEDERTEPHKSGFGAESEQQSGISPIAPEPPLPAIPRGHRVHKVSTLVDAVTGESRLQWIKTTAESNQIADITEAFASIKDELPQADGPQPLTTAQLNSRLLSTYLLGDCHVGMHAWRGDAGENFDLKIAERNLTTLTGELIRLAPESERALIVNIGDYFHSDNRNNTTTKGTGVDVDGRWSKVLGVGIRIMRRIIDAALQKHQHVTVINEIGNHDTHTSIFLSLALAQFYECEPRVVIDVSPRMFHYYRFGKVQIMTHHGHNVKPRDLVGVLASDRAEDWGQTLFRYIYTGHIHHEKSCDFPGVHWRSLRSPAPSDAWHDSMGYRSSHELSLEIHDAERGLINRHIVGVPKNLGAAA